MSFLTAALDFRNRHFISNFQVKVAGLVTKKKLFISGTILKSNQIMATAIGLLSDF